MIRCGTTTAEIKSGYGLNLETELKMLKVAKSLEQAAGITVVRTFLGCHSVPPEANTKLDYLNHVIEDMLPAVSKECEYVDIFVEDKYFDAKDAKKLADAAKIYKLGLRMHVDQMRDSGGALLAAQLGADTADHLEYSNIQGIAMMGIHNVTPILLPGSVYGIRSDHYPSFKELRKEALPYVLATDFNPGSSPTPSLPFCMSLGVTKMGMSVAEALTACTINAAASLKRADKFGSLEPGKAADLVIWGFKDYRELGYWAGYTPVEHVLKFGQALYQAK
jgi:imidazolonepropionase